MGHVVMTGHVLISWMPQQAPQSLFVDKFIQNSVIDVHVVYKSISKNIFVFITQLYNRLSASKSSILSFAAACYLQSPCSLHLPGDFNSLRHIQLTDQDIF